MEVEENSKRVMDDFVLVLKEVVIELNYVKEKFKFIEE